jgi:hypothetical protein
MSSSMDHVVVHIVGVIVDLLQPPQDPNQNGQQ